MGKVIQPADVRSRLREALEIDLIGPGTGHSLADERLPGWVRPSNWYLTGFLVPREAPAEQRADADADDDFEPEVAGEGGLGDDTTEDRRAARKGFFPSSMGLSFLVAEGVDELEVTVRWGDYHFVKEASADDGDADTPDDDAAAGGERSASTWWQRTARTEAVRVMLPGRTIRGRTVSPARAGWSSWPSLGRCMLRALLAGFRRGLAPCRCSL